ncbi:trifunctional serine/threonine-protein kinase/ATP-binding protein/sensor histidine kinase [Sorangium sp. So ce341]|uniref:trifunctional serine/threonine-protein kinase/ATP-binding protein/sensor histidine kinase n=1 Tax=Sorangium sp. So ce341 TaxID=3133302 RepID=UPI003F621EEA
MTTSHDPAAVCLRDDGELALYRSSEGPSALILRPVHAPSADLLQKLENEFALREELDSAWAVCPRELDSRPGRTRLWLEDPGGELLAHRVGRAWPIGDFLRVALGWTRALDQLHARGIVHKDIKPANALVDVDSGAVWLTGFGAAARAADEQRARPPTLVGSLPYMAPEQTGRMSRAVDTRSDMYALGVSFYELLTGGLPFAASEPMEWIHCHVAKQPADPRDRVAELPAPLAAIVMKLLSKPAEERYQTAAGLARDLERCLLDWSAHGRIEPFSLASGDARHRSMPERLYGRDRERNALLSAFERVRTSGAPELVLVSGYSGIGKSALVDELRRAIGRRAAFASGKFDQFKRDIPYATFAQALESLVRQVLGRPAEELSAWREALRDALGTHGGLVTNLVPDVEFIVGPQPPAPELPPHDAKQRFQLIFRRLIAVFAEPEHPLVLFLDDLQWLDAATLDLIEHLALHPELANVLIVGAFRSNEVDAEHALHRLVARLRAAAGRVEEISLAALASHDVADLLADVLQADAAELAPLSELVHEKTHGNPFFAIQFINALNEAELLHFDPAKSRWRWDLERIRARGFTDNVAELMIEKLTRLPEPTRRALMHLACLGICAPIEALALALGTGERELTAALDDALRSGLVVRVEREYRFLHDRVQEASYALIDPRERPALHLAIGMRLSAESAERAREEGSFDIVNQLNRGLDLLRTRRERMHVAELNHAAGRRAKAASAYTSALVYLGVADALLDEDRWQSDYALAFALGLDRAECELLAGELTAAEACLTQLAPEAADLVDRAAVARLRILLYTTAGRNGMAVQVCLDFLGTIGIDWTPRPTRDEVEREFQSLWDELGDRSIESLIDLPVSNDSWRAALDVLTAAQPPALFTDSDLHDRLVARMARLSLAYGNSDGSCYAYAVLGVVLGSTFRDYPAGNRFGKLGFDLVAARGFERFKARAYMSYGAHVNTWAQHIDTSLVLVRRAHAAALEALDLTFAGFSSETLVTLLLGSGAPLSEVAREAERGLTLARRSGFGLVEDIITSQLQLIRLLRGHTPSFASFDDDDFDEASFEQHFVENPQLAFATCWYWIRKLQGRFFARDYAAALAAARQAEALLWTSPGHFEVAEFHFYTALVRAALYDASSREERTRHAEALYEHERILALWARHCPDNFENRAKLVAAEAARIERRELAAERLYEEAISSARKHGFTQNEAVASEMAARFYAVRGLSGVALAYLRSARDGYAHWQATGKVTQLELLEPRLRAEPALTRSSIGAARVEQLDLSPFLKASQALSGEIQLERLIRTLMTIALEGAGAERALLITPRGEELWVEAEAVTAADHIEVRLVREPTPASDAPASILRYAVRTQQPLLLGDAALDARFAADEHVRRTRPRSIFCVPLAKQARLSGVLYLENNLASHAFTPSHLTLLELLASQMAISLENARLFDDLQRENTERRKVEELLRRTKAYLAEAESLSDTGSFGWKFATGDLFWSEETYRIYEVEPGTNPSLPPLLERVPKEERANVQQAFERAKSEGQMMLEHRLLCAGGRVKHLRIRGRARTSSDGSAEIVGAVMDVTASRRAADDLEEARAQLAHVARTTTLGELAASIAHEVNQPLAAIAADASAGINWLDRAEPDLVAVRESLVAIVNDGHRAGDVLARIRRLLARSVAHRERCRLDAVIGAALPVAEAELARRRIALDLRLRSGGAQVFADPVELQQVILNLLLNAAEASRDLPEARRRVRLETALSEAAGRVWVVGAVSDAGVGLSHVDGARLFEAFYTTKPGGLGMGLSISRSILERHGGRLWAEPNPVFGATFRFELPAVEEA